MGFLRPSTASSHSVIAKKMLFMNEFLYNSPIVYIVYISIPQISTHNQYDENDYEEVAVEKRVYPDKEVTGSHDIAILVLAKPVSFDREIHPICLPTSDDFVWKGEKVLYCIVLY